MSESREQCRGERRAVAPVLGIVLMVAIAVSLAAVVGLSAFGVADEIADVGPSASFEYDYDYGERWNEGDSITITHAAGDEIRVERIEIEIQGSDTISGEEVFDDEVVTAGSSATIEYETGEHGENWSGGSTIRVVWQGSAGETSVVSSRTIPA